ncbi:MAG: lipopolysaccharide heptosyltransferase II [Gammaproteobacteria bacterium]|nr:lipopolysaccharide heptosyltransferase II [Gammaproteobacteria bacterium]
MSKILVIGPSWVGDIVMAQSLFKLLKARHPGVELTVAVPKYAMALLEAMPEVDSILELPFAHGEFAFLKRRAFGRSLKTHHFTQSIVLPNSWKSALIPFFAGVPIRTGFKGEVRFGLLNDLRYLDKKALPLMVQRFCALGLLDAESLPKTLPNPQFVLKSEWEEGVKSKFALEPSKPILALCPGAEFGPAKQWPAESYAALAKEKLAEGWQVCLMGSPKDRTICEAISAQLEGPVHNLAGQTTLKEAMALLRQATAVVSNDSGLMHISAALGRPVVVVYGSTSPDFTPPLSDRSKIVAADTPCRPCFQRTCPLKGDQFMRCMRDVRVQDVLNALDSLLA